MATFEKVWQFDINRNLGQATVANTCKNDLWWIKGFLCGHVPSQTIVGTTQGGFTQGLWTVYQSSDGLGNFGTAGDGYDRWNTLGATTGNSGSVANIVTGATITGAVRLSGLTGMTSGSVGNFIGIQGASTAANNSPGGTSSSTGTIGFKVVNFVSSSSVDVWNPSAVIGDASNGFIQWNERAAPTLNTSNIITATAGTNHSWIVIKSPLVLGPYYIIIDYNVGSGTPYQAQFIISKAAPTGGTATARPTSTDEVQPTASTNCSFNLNIVNSYGCGALSTDGYFWLGTNRGIGTVGNFEYGMVFQVIADTKSADTYKGMFFVFGGLASGNPFNTSTFRTVGNWGARNFNGTTSTVTMAPMDMSYNTSTVTFDSLALADFTDGQYDDAPVYICSNTLGQYTIKGRLIDIRRGPSSLPEGFTEPNPSSPSSIFLGGYWWPCNLPINF